MIVFNKTRGLIISQNVKLADNFFKRLVGLISEKEISGDYGIMIPNCISVHTCFMKFAIDVVFIERSMRVIDISMLKPWRFSKIYPQAYGVLEFKAGFTYDKISIGDLIEMRDKI